MATHAELVHLQQQVDSANAQFQDIYAALTLLSVYLVAAGFFCLFLSNAMKRISPEHRPFSGRLVWLSFVPVVGYLWGALFAFFLTRGLQRDLALSGQEKMANTAVVASALGVGISFCCLSAGVVAARPFGNGALLGLFLFYHLLAFAFWLELPRLLPKKPRRAAA